MITGICVLDVLFLQQKTNIGWVRHLLCICVIFCFVIFPVTSLARYDDEPPSHDEISPFTPLARDRKIVNLRRYPYQCLIQKGETLGLPPPKRKKEKKKFPPPLLPTKASSYFIRFNLMYLK